MSEREHKNTDGETESPRILQLREMLKSKPDDVFLNYAIGLEFAAIGQHAHALGSFKKTLAIDDQYLAAYYHGAKSAQEIGDQDSSKSLIESGLAVAMAKKDMKTHQELLFLQEDFGFDEE